LKTNRFRGGTGATPWKAKRKDQEGLEKERKKKKNSKKEERKRDGARGTKTRGFQKTNPCRYRGDILEILSKQSMNCTRKKAQKEGKVLEPARETPLSSFYPRREKNGGGGTRRRKKRERKESWV